MGAHSTEQLTLFGVDADQTAADTTTTFADNVSLPVHRWFRYSAGFSALWARQLIEEHSGRLGRLPRVLDPFAGSGTTLLEAQSCGAESVGLEAHPFIVRVAAAKLCWTETPAVLSSSASETLAQAKALETQAPEYPALMARCYPPAVLSRLDALRRAWASRADGSPASQLTWLALAAILRDCAAVGTAQWQYLLPNKTKARPADPYAAFAARVRLMADDMVRWQRRPPGPPPELHWGDARDCSPVPDAWADLVVTSPPYANNYDYADATRLEMTFFGEIAGWGDLQAAVRQYLVRSCTQHAAPLAAQTDVLLEEPLLEPVREGLADRCCRLEAERATHGGKKPYHTMVAAYFGDMARVWVALRRATTSGGLVCFVVGDSAPYGVHVPVDAWLGELAVAAGFESYSFEKTRDRNTKWKNRKHRVPLHEGRLWVRG